VNEYAALPVLQEMPREGVCLRNLDGAYYRISGEHAQVVVIGPMHFTPGEYLDALNELTEDYFRLYHSDFMGTPNQDIHELVLRRGFVNLMAVRGC
jgi:hypothetical protein